MAFDIQFKLIYQGIRDVFRVRSLSKFIVSRHEKDSDLVDLGRITSGEEYLGGISGQLTLEK